MRTILRYTRRYSKDMRVEYLCHICYYPWQYAPTIIWVCVGGRAHKWYRSTSFIHTYTHSAHNSHTLRTVCYVCRHFSESETVSGVERAANGFYRLHRQLFCLSHKINKFKIVRHTRTAYEATAITNINHPPIHTR